MSIANRLNRSDFADLAYFLVVARHLNYRRAAVDLGISASGVSHALKSLEGRLGVRLLNRTNRSMTLTAAGEALRDALDGPFEAIGTAVDVLNEFRDTPTGHVRLSVPVGAANLILAPVLPVFVERYPNILVDLSVCNRMIDVVGHGFDAGIRFGGTVPEDMIAQRLSPDMKWVVAAAPSYLERHGVPQTPEELAEHKCMQLRVGDDTIYKWEFEKGGEEFSVNAPGPIIVDDGRIAIKLAVQGAGLIYMNEWDIKDHLSAGTLVTVLDEWASPGEGFYMYYSSRRQVPRGVRLLANLIRELRPLG